jgi:hypothetical protein
MISCGVDRVSGGAICGVSSGPIFPTLTATEAIGGSRISSDAILQEYKVLILVTPKRKIEGGIKETKSSAGAKSQCPVYIFHVSHACDLRTKHLGATGYRSRDPRQISIRNLVNPMHLQYVAADKYLDSERGLLRTGDITFRVNYKICTV